MAEPTPDRTTSALSAAAPSSNPSTPQAPSATVTMQTTARPPLSTLPTSTPTPVPALATTKRKFHNLLASLTNPPSTKRPASTPFSPFSGVDSPAKRIRLEARARLESSSAAASTPQVYESEAARVKAEARARVQTQLLRTRLEAARSTSSLASVAEGGSGEGVEAETLLREPKYNPWSHAGFLRRMETFSNVRLWSSKPDEVNEVVWAKRGWTCVGVNTVACKGGCEERVVVGLRPARKDEEGKDIDGTEDLSAEVPEELTRRYEELAETGHDEDCLWRCRGGCKDDIYRLPLSRQSIWQPALRARYLSFLPSVSCIPPASAITSPTNTAHLAQRLPPDFLASPPTTVPLDAPPTTPPQTPALAFALTGWSLSPASTPNHPIATCSACFRRLGLWLHTPAPSDADADTRPKLNLTAEHRTHCPWTNPASQHMGGSLAGLAGWEVLARCIENAARFRKGADASRGVEGGSALPGVEGGSALLGVEGGRAGEGDTNGEEDAGSAAGTWKAKSKGELEREDKARFAKLRALTESIGLKGLRRTLAGRRFN